MQPRAGDASQSSPTYSDALNSGRCPFNKRPMSRALKWGNEIIFLCEWLKGKNVPVHFLNVIGKLRDATLLIFLTEGQLFYTVVFLYAVAQSDSVTYMLFFLFFPIMVRSLGSAVGPGCRSILNRLGCTCRTKPPVLPSPHLTP